MIGLKGFEEQGVDAGIEQDLGLGAEGVGMASGGRADASDDEGLGISSQAGELDGGSIQERNISLAVEAGEPVGVGVEGVGGEDHGASGAVGLVEGVHGVGMVERPEAGIVAGGVEAGRKEPGAEAGVEHQIAAEAIGQTACALRRRHGGVGPFVPGSGGGGIAPRRG